MGCISCPTIYRQLRSLKPESLSVKLFEYDRRFAIYQEDFIFYDYNQPQSVVSTDMQNYFDLIIADPPFLSEECLEKIAATVRGLSKDKIILCTGKDYRSRFTESNHILVKVEMIVNV